jgi:FkbM family methyltransferase
VKKIEHEFQAACALIGRPPLLKLINPGTHKLMARWLARRGGVAKPREITLFFGACMTVVLPEVISEALYTYGVFDEPVTWMAMQAVRPGDVVYDVGAHFGYFSLLFAHLAAPNGRVFSFEPTPSTFAVLKKNVQGNADITPLNCAAGVSPGNIDIADFGLRHSAWNTLAPESRMPGILDTSEARRISVEIVTLDSQVATHGLHPDFIKIDAENFEHAVVSGARNIITQSQPVILLESGSQAALEAMLELEQLGYQTLVSDKLGSLRTWAGGLTEANRIYKDLLFVPRSRMDRFGALLIQ